MSASRPVVVHHPEGTPGQEVPGIERRQQFEREGRWASWIRIESGKTALAAERVLRAVVRESEGL
jgi:hypothetical protein